MILGCAYGHRDVPHLSRARQALRPITAAASQGVPMTQTWQSAEHLSPAQISAYVDRELSAGDRSTAEQHLADCHACTLKVLDAMKIKKCHGKCGEQRRCTGGCPGEVNCEPAQTNTANTRAAREDGTDLLIPCGSMDGSRSLPATCALAGRLASDSPIGHNVR